MNYQIVLKDIEPIHVAYMKYVGVVTEANKVFPHVFKAIMGKTNGAPLFNYLSLNKETKIERWNFVFQQTQHLLEMV